MVETIPRRKIVCFLQAFKRISDRTHSLKTNVGLNILTILSIYTPQMGLDETIKDAFYDSMYSGHNWGI